MVINHESARYKRERLGLSLGERHNGAYYYSREICKNIIPRVRTARNWLTVDYVGAKPFDHAIAFVHNNEHPEHYKEWAGLDAVLVCGVRETVDKVKDYGKAIYLPLSIDVEYVRKYTAEKTRDVCYAGRKAKMQGVPASVDILTDLPRDLMLAELARYRRVYAVGRLALEAIALGCEVLPYDKRYPDVSVWRLLDNRDAAIMLQKELDIIDGRTKCTI